VAFHLLAHYKALARFNQAASPSTWRAALLQEQLILGQ